MHQADQDPPVDDVPAGGLSCFISQDRICGPDCMAFSTAHAPGSPYVGEQWACCRLLVNVERSGKHLVVLADGINKAVTLMATEQRLKKAPGI